MAIHETLVLGVILVVVVGIFAIVYRIRTDLRRDDDIDSAQLSSAISETWRKMGLDQTVGQLVAVAVVVE